jgi:hypothetical protein
MSQMAKWQSLMLESYAIQYASICIALPRGDGRDLSHSPASGSAIRACMMFKSTSEMETTDTSGASGAPSIGAHRKRKLTIDVGMKSSPRTLIQATQKNALDLIGRLIAWAMHIQSGWNTHTRAG